MIYPVTCGKGEEHLRLRTLESVWIRGQLSLWGCWSAIRKSPQAAGVFSRLLAQPVISKKALQAAMKRMKQAGLTEKELLWIFGGMQEKQSISRLWFCTDSEGLKMDAVIARVMEDDSGLLNILKEHYLFKKSYYGIAFEMHERCPEISLSTCRRRIVTWLSVAEFMLYRPMCDELERNGHYVD
ncbi:DUF1133 family protein [Xenorhabdus bovienii]|uniref:DUF1133 family protein n=1 Tax=Xenorhabdus bovienii TaxID=40576 RepID=UPI00237D325E|nr:DUF1133 family protein [Xenorhabdus bovienii]MDE1483421.1 DUF1133 family protein [Xenorhabdus bovienii]MDE1494525.1 DUF1133 family protein [Xenorhabdus bovienii]MDE9434281.1 DUF1133 family protein [Xenorhabdus bovienii]MDE9442502.1 DUF1133 family protein [Xenorhabdus bovienii]MDE9462614.1 DUF1133 family protein [Xenorhabdus bovienii]